MSAFMDHCTAVDTLTDSPDQSPTWQVQDSSPPSADRSEQREFTKTSRQEFVQLLSRCASGDQRSFERLYRETSARLFGLVLRIVKDPHIASEVLQESYIKIWTHASEFHPDKAAPMTWMGAIVRHQAIDWVRRTVRRPGNTEPAAILDSLTDEEEGPLERTVRTQQEQQIHDCLKHLPETQRRAVILVYVNGLTHEELARYLGKPLGTVKTWVRRGLLRLIEARSLSPC